MPTTRRARTGRDARNGPTSAAITGWVRTFALVVANPRSGRLADVDLCAVEAACRLRQTRDEAVSVAVFDELNADAPAGRADRILDLRDGDGVIGIERRGAALLALARRLQPDHIIFPQADRPDAGLARWLAVEMGVPIASRVYRIEVQAGTCCSLTAEPGVSALMPLPVIIEIKPAAAEPVDHTAHTPLRKTVCLPALPEPEMRPVALVSGTASAPPLSEAEFILSAGDGLEDWGMFDELASRLGAEIAGSRVVVDAGHLPRSRQVGSSGHTVRARVYLALGISGAPQHLHGISTCEYVIAVNTDPNCPMMRRADLPIVCDAQAFMTALLERLNEAAAHGVVGDTCAAQTCA